MTTSNDVCVCGGGGIWRPALSLSFRYYLPHFLKQFLTEPGSHQLGEPGWPASRRGPLSCLPSTGLEENATYAPRFFTLVWGLQLRLSSMHNSVVSRALKCISYCMWTEGNKKNVQTMLQGSCMASFAYSRLRFSTARLTQITQGPGCNLLLWIFPCPAWGYSLGLE